jgi:hypothetical protein
LHFFYDFFSLAGIKPVSNKKGGGPAIEYDPGYDMLYIEEDRAWPYESRRSFPDEMPKGIQAGRRASGKGEVPEKGAMKKPGPDETFRKKPSVFFGR